MYMSNILDFGCSRAAPSKLSSIGTSVKYFPRPLGPSLTQVPFGNAGAVPFGGTASTPNASNPTGSLWFPVGASFDGRLFNVVAAGTYGFDSGDPSGTVLVGLYAVTGTFTNPVIASNLIASTGTMTPTFAAAVPWALDVTLVGDNVSGLLTGYYSALGNGASGVGLVNSSPKSVDTVISGLDFINGNTALQRGAVFGLVVGVTFGTNDATNRATMTQFNIN
jgi:hypothetical protein